MTRKAFIKACGVLGIGFSQTTLLASCEDNNVSPKFSGSVLIIGAGVAGLSAAYLLEQQGISYQILEASATYGGRIKITNSFTDFPIPLGAEWLHVETDIFNEAVNDDAVQVNVNTVGYNATDNYGKWENGTLTMDTLGNYEDRKFINASWFGFFDEYIVPSVKDKISYHQIVSEIDYTSDKIRVTTQGGQTFTADKVIVTASLKMLKENTITFLPTLPDKKQNAINNASFWDGIKVFIEFTNKFYPTFVEFPIAPKEAGEKAYFDAAYGQNSDKHILGLFAVGEPSLPYRALTGNALKDFILDELDQIFSNQATLSYVQHIEQNWSNEPFIKGAYLNDYEDESTVETLSENLENKVYFAGEAYTDGSDWGGVHAAIRAAKEAVNQLTE
jgi:monoamine oxidase